MAEKNFCIHGMPEGLCSSCDGGVADTTLAKTKPVPFVPPQVQPPKQGWREEGKPPATNYGWICPQCGNVYAPTQAFCLKCSKG